MDGLVAGIWAVALLLIARNSPNCCKRRRHRTIVAGPMQFRETNAILYEIENAFPKRLPTEAEFAQLVSQGLAASASTEEPIAG